MTGHRGFRVSGPLARHAEGFRAMLAGRGYAPSPAAGQLQVMAHLSRRLAQQGRPADVTPPAVGQFLLARKGAGYRRWLSARGVAPLLEYLEAAGLFVAAVSPLGGDRARQAGLLLGSCDRGTAAGLRDYAVLVLLTRLGLRVSEVAATPPSLPVPPPANPTAIKDKGAVQAHPNPPFALRPIQVRRFRRASARSTAHLDRYMPGLFTRSC